MAPEQQAAEIVSRKLIELSLTKPPVPSFNRQLVRIVVDTVGASAATLWLLNENELVLCEELEQTPGTVRGIATPEQQQQNALRICFEQSQMVVFGNTADGQQTTDANGVYVNSSLVFTPVVGLQGNLGVLRLVFPPMHPALLSRQVQLAETLCGYYSLYSAQRILSAQHEERRDVDKLSKAILQLQHYSFSGQLEEVISNSAAEVARVDRTVLLTTRSNGTLKLASVSSVTEPDKKGAWAKLITELGELILQADRPFQFIPGLNSLDEIEDEELRDRVSSYVTMTEVKTLMIFPLASRNDKAGVLVIESFQDPALSSFERVLCTVYASHAGSALVNYRLFRTVPFSGYFSTKLIDDVEGVRRGHSRFKKILKRGAIAAALIGLAWFGAIRPTPEEIGALCYVEPHEVRLITAPQDGEIEVVLFGRGMPNGFEVPEGRLVLKMRDDQILLALQAEKKKAAQVALEVVQLRAQATAAKNDEERQTLLGRLSTKKAELEAKKIEVKLQQKLLDQCKIYSPIDGTIIEPDDPAQLVKIPVREGQLLCRVGSLSEKVRIMVAIPSERSHLVEPGADVTIQLRSLVHIQTIEGKIESISRRSENYESSNVFMATVVVPATVMSDDGSEVPLSLKPGMTGKANVILEDSTYVRIFGGALLRKLDYWLF